MRGIVFFLAGLLGMMSALAAATEYEIIQVTDRGMEPTYQVGDLVLVNRSEGGEDDASTEATDLMKGDVVLLENPIFQETGENALMLKRVAAVPGDRVCIEDGTVYVNDVAENLSDEAKGDIRTCIAEQEVPTDAYFVLGDNRGQSSDSRDRAIGMVKRENIRGKVIEIW